MRAVEVVGDRELQFGRRLEPFPAHGVQIRSHIFDVERTVRERPPVGSDATLGSLEVGTYLVPAPAGISEITPVVEIGRHPAAVHHGVDGARSAHDPAAGPVHTSIVEAAAAAGLEFPIDARIGEGDAVADGRLDPEPRVRAAGLEDQDAIAPAGGQPVRQYASRGARTHDDVVEALHAGQLNPLGGTRYAISRFTHAIFRRAASGRSAAARGGHLEPVAGARSVGVASGGRTMYGAKSYVRGVRI